MNDKILDGWKEIAEYVGKSIRTVQRWEKEEGFPIRRIKSKKSVFAYPYEIDLWLKDRGKNKTLDVKRRKESGCYEDSTLHINKTLDKKNIKGNNLLNSPFLIGVLSIIVLLFVGYSFTSYKRVRMLQKRKLFGEVAGGGSVLNIKDQYGNILKTFWCEKKVFKNYLYPVGNLRHFQFLDLNNDGILDMVYGEVCPECKKEIKILISNSKGELVQKQSINLDIQYENMKENYIYKNFLFINLVVSDLDNDGRPEIIVIQNNVPFYPSCVRIFDLEGNEKFRFLNPGRLDSLEVRDGENGKTIVLTGTNNYLHKFSVPVVIFLTSRWSFQNQKLDFIQPENTDFDFLSSLKIVYIAFFLDDVKIDRYYRAKFSNDYNEKNLMHFVAYESPEVKIIKYSIMGVDLLFRPCVLNIITTNYGRLVKKFIIPEYIMARGISNPEKYCEQHFKVLYYDGRDWQSAYTPITKEFVSFKKIASFK